MSFVEHLIVRMCQAVLWVSTTIIFVILCVNTLLRYSGGGSVQWGNEVPELLFPWLVMAGVVMGAVHGSHITTTFLIDAVSPAIRRWVLSIGWVVVAVLYAVLFVATWRMLDIVHDERSPILGVPGSMTYGCVMVGIGFLSILALLSAWRSFTTLKAA
jgi:TRAP-type transport system small permease protein